MSDTTEREIKTETDPATGRTRTMERIPDRAVWGNDLTVPLLMIRDCWLIIDERPTTA